MAITPLALTVTPNAALDKTYLVDHFAVDRIHRPHEFTSTAGGKGINVARVLHTLGAQAVATGFLAGHIGREVRESLREEGITDGFVDVDGETRLCIKVMDTAARTQTEINEPGPVIDERAAKRLQERFEALLPDCRWVVVAGNLPPGLPPEWCANLIRAAKSRGLRTALDTSGEPLRLGLAAAPDVVKPNAAELSEALGREIETVGEAAEAGRELLKMGVHTAAITLGRCGAVAVDATGAWYAQPPEVEFKSAVGSGDAFLAALVLALDEGRNCADALRYATAAGAANVSNYGAGYLERHTVEHLAPRVTVKPI
ncbi:MAG TPA: 1-phosphofructokinase [Armatimonadota bacterium]|jgi:1-phosphofructokinase family hexose kinase